MDRDELDRRRGNDEDSMFDRIQAADECEANLPDARPAPSHLESAKANVTFAEDTVSLTMAIVAIAHALTGILETMQSVTYTMHNGETVVNTWDNSNNNSQF